MAAMSTPLYPLVDRILDGQLAQELAERRENGDSYQTISKWLLTEHAIDVTAETVRKWVMEETVGA